MDCGTTFSIGMSMEERVFLWLSFFFWWVFGGTVYVSNLPLKKRQEWGAIVLCGKSAEDLGWMVRHTRMDKLNYPVTFPDGKLGKAALLIHDTSDEDMKQLKKDKRTFQLKCHTWVIDQMKKKGRYRIGVSLWTPPDRGGETEAGGD